MGTIEGLEKYIPQEQSPNKSESQSSLLCHWGMALRKVEIFIKALRLNRIEGSNQAVASQTF
ncbi:hypothetical protein [Hydrogenivirga sp. 128-5-R1-1]|uniref:hypothetical protein n=1 Tax=Hydrogenivirga sp. 128-5-R1-1 TaxID=392423 RepID=UPI00015F3399|nr:hypothetical protein [Hydrogenivirga sp. 128-5-R1-1]EDP74843.1 hypothetical protein HG1285_13282 [Hydrogenivirga sp. 128-5-R1-1]